MSIKSKLLMYVAGVTLALSMLIVGVLAAVSQTITMEGIVNIDVPDRTLYFRDMRVAYGDDQSAATVSGFRKGYFGKDFQLNGSIAFSGTNTATLYLDFVNLIIDGHTTDYIAEARWASGSVSGVSFSIDSGSEKIAEGTVSAENFSLSTPLSGTVVLEITSSSAINFDLSNIALTIREPVDLSDVEYSINENNEIVIESWGSGENIIIPGSVSIVDGQLVDGGDYKVTSISDNAFANNATIKTVTLPDSITSIGANAFAGCQNLTTINLPDGLTEIGYHAFMNSEKLTDIVLPDSLTTIGERAFFDCLSISGTLNIPASVTTIGESALVIMGLEEFTVDDGNQNFAAVDGILYSKDMKRLIACPTNKAITNFVMPSTVEIIENDAFNNCRKVTGQITLSPVLTRISNSAFSRCSGLTGQLHIPASVTFIGDGAFGGCNFSEFIVEGNTAYKTQSGALYDADMTVLLFYPSASTNENFDIPDSVTELYEGAIRSAANLKSISLPSNLQTIRHQAISDCQNLTGELVIPNTVTTIEQYPFYGCGFTAFSIDNEYYKSVDGVLYNADITTLIQYPSGKTDTSFVVPSTVTLIAEYSIYNVKNLTEITIPSSVTGLGAGAFGGGNTNLKTVIVGSQGVASLLSNRSGAYYLILYADTVYVSESVASSLPASFGTMFTEVSSDKSGYKKYIEI